MFLDNENLSLVMGILSSDRKVELLDITKEEDNIRWQEQFIDPSNRIVGHDRIQGVIVSTVFLGINHSFGYYKPLWFETMIFNSEEEELQDFQVRYSTYEEALEGHKRAVALVKREITIN